ncbi:hypothetical protein Hanom_Chr06g00529041 [Helianthus anomalus]
MAELNNQPPQSVAGGTSTFNEDLKASFNGFTLKCFEVLRSENENVDDFGSDLHPNGTNDDDDGIQADEELYVQHTPNGTRMWCPNVPTILRHVVGCVYETSKDVLEIVHFLLLCYIHFFIVLAQLVEICSCDSDDPHLFAITCILFYQLDVSYL